jgi:hypothetical protein
VFLQVASILSACCICFTCVYLDVAYVCNGFQVFDTHVSIVLSVLFYMLQVFASGCLKVDQVLHVRST